MRSLNQVPRDVKSTVEMLHTPLIYRRVILTPSHVWAKLAGWPRGQVGAPKAKHLRLLYFLPSTSLNQVSKIIKSDVAIVHTHNLTVPWRKYRRVVCWPPLMWEKSELRRRSGTPKAQACVQLSVIITVPEIESST